MIPFSIAFASGHSFEQISRFPTSALVGVSGLNPLRIGALIRTPLSLLSLNGLFQGLNPLRIGALIRTQYNERAKRHQHQVSIPFASGHSFEPDNPDELCRAGRKH